MTTKDLPQRQKVIIRFMRIPLPGIISALLLMYACINFAHIHPNPFDKAVSLSNINTLNRQSFFVTFYVFIGFGTVFLLLSYMLRRQIYRILMIIPSFVCIVLAVYAVPDFFTIKIYLYSAWIITAVMLPEIPLNMIIGFAGTCTAAFFVVSECIGYRYYITYHKNGHQNRKIYISDLFIRYPYLDGKLTLCNGKMERKR